jgi:hypothetical protein
MVTSNGRKGFRRMRDHASISPKLIGFAAMPAVRVPFNSRKIDHIRDY